MQSEIKLPWSDWKIVRRLGGGSFGSVYEIERDLLGTIEHAAVKIITVPHDMSEYNELSASGFDLESINSRFYADLSDIANEYSLMAALKGNANIIHCEDIQYQKNENGIGYSLFIRMELLHTMTEVIGTQPDDVTVIKVGTDLCNALSACRRHNIIHRDIKPGNILIARDGTCKLGDFGVSKTTDRTAGGTKTGTYGFMAPEVYNSRPYNAGVDIYSLGMVLYWMLNRRTGPFLPLPPQLPSAREVDEAKQKRFSGTPLPPPADGSEALRQVVLKATAYDPAARFQTPEEFAAALRAAAPAQAPKAAASVSASQQTKAPTRSAAAEEATVGNNWGYTDEATQGSVGASGYDSGATVGATSYADDRAAAGQTAKNGQPVRVSGDLDIVTSLALTPEEAMLGCRKRVTVNGKSYDITVHPFSREGLGLRINGRGKEDPATGARGNLIVRLHIREPKAAEDYTVERTPFGRIRHLNPAAAAGDFWGEKAEPDLGLLFAGAVTLHTKDAAYGKKIQIRGQKIQIPQGCSDGKKLGTHRFFFLDYDLKKLKKTATRKEILENCSDLDLYKYAHLHADDPLTAGLVIGFIIVFLLAVALGVIFLLGRPLIGIAVLVFFIGGFFEVTAGEKDEKLKRRTSLEADIMLRRRFPHAPRYDTITGCYKLIDRMLVAVGDRVEEEQAICALKIGREVKTHSSGIIRELRYIPGYEYDVTDIIAIIEVDK